jgi:hypothetical protein
MSTKKSLKQCSLEELEIAISKAITEVTGCDSETVINNFKAVGVTSALEEKDSFNLDLSIKVGRSYKAGW